MTNPLDPRTLLALDEVLTELTPGPTSRNHKNVPGSMRSLCGAGLRDLCLYSRVVERAHSESSHVNAYGPAAN